MLDLVGKSICCILCRGSILYFDETGFTKFGRHMQFEHGAMHDLDFMMAACKMNDSEKKALVEVFNKKVESVEVVKENSATVAPPPPSTPKKSGKENKPVMKRTPKKKETVSSPENLSKSIDKFTSEENGNVLKTTKETKVCNVVKEVKSPKDVKEIKSPKDVKEIKSPKDVKEIKSPKDVKEIKSPKDVKELKAPKVVEEVKAPKEMAHKDVKEELVPKHMKQTKTSKDVCDQNTPKKSDRGNSKCSPNRTPKKALDNSETEHSVNKDILSFSLEDDVEKPEVPTTDDAGANNQKNKKFRLVIKPKSKQLARYASKVKNNKDLKGKAEKSKCNNCDKIFKNEQKLLKHVEKEHPGLKTKSRKYACGKCSISFKVKSALKEHVRNIHVVSKHNVKEGREILNCSQEKLNTSATLTDSSIESDKGGESIVGSKPNEDKPGNGDVSSEGEIKVSGVRKEGVKSKIDNNNSDEISVSENPRSSKKMKVEALNVNVGGNVDGGLHNASTSTNVVTRKSPRKVSPDLEAELASDETSNCDLCKELSNNFSKLRRHQKYVHGIKGTDFKYVEPSEEEDEEDEEEEEENSVLKQTTGTSFHEIELEQIGEVIELRSCLKKQNSSGKKRSISFNETIFYKEFNKEEAVCTLSEDKQDDEVLDKSSSSANPPLAEANVSPRPVGRPRKSTANSPTITSSLKSLKNSTPSPKKRKDDGEGLSEPSPKKQIIDKVLAEDNDDEFEADTALAIRLSLESATTSDLKISESQPVVEAENSKNTQPMETILLFPCEPCAISYESKQELLKHEQDYIHKNVEPTLDTLEIQSADKVVEQPYKEKELAKHEENSNANKSTDVVKDSDKAMQANTTPNDGMKRSEYITLSESPDEGKPQKISGESSVEKELKPKTDFVLKQELLSEALLNESSDGGGMVSFPMDSFLETILTEEPVEARLHDAIDSFTANLKANNEKSDSLAAQNESIIKSEPHKNPTEEVKPLVEVSKDVDVLSESLQKKYSKAPKRVDFTQSNFFMKHAELIGKSVNGGGFKEISSFLPDGWKMKTYNEVKKFFLTPDFVVLKSPTAVVEYLRLSLDVSHEDLKSLSRNLKIVGKQFDRYLDELYDDCVVLE